MLLTSSHTLRSSLTACVHHDNRSFSALASTTCSSVNLAQVSMTDTRAGCVFNSGGCLIFLHERGLCHRRHDASGSRLVRVSYYSGGLLLLYMSVRLSTWLVLNLPAHDLYPPTSVKSGQITWRPNRKQFPRLMSAVSRRFSSKHLGEYHNLLSSASRSSRCRICRAMRPKDSV